MMCGPVLRVLDVSLCRCYSGHSRLTHRLTYRLASHESPRVISHIEDGMTSTWPDGGSQGMRLVPSPPKPGAVLLAAPGSMLSRRVHLHHSFIINGGLF